MKFKTVILCLKLLTCLIVQRSFGNILFDYVQKLAPLWFKTSYTPTLSKQNEYFNNI